MPIKNYKMLKQIKTLIILACVRNIEIERMGLNYTYMKNFSENYGEMSLCWVANGNKNINNLARQNARLEKQDVDKFIATRCSKHPKAKNTIK